MRPLGYHRATSLDDALARRRSAPATDFLAGGTTLLDLVKLDVMRPTHLVDISRLDLAEIADTSAGGLRIGANVRNSTLAWHDTVKRRYPVLAQAILAGASPQIRNMATTAGNLLQRTRCPYFRDNLSPCNKREPGTGCAALDGYNRSHAVLGTSPHCIATHPSDLCVALAILDATVHLTGPAGDRTIPFDQLHLLPDEHPQREHALADNELITAITLPPPPDAAHSAYLKRRDRESYEFALASAAVLLVVRGGRITRARVALGGVATKPWRSPAAEFALLEAPPTAGTVQAAARAALADAAPRRHNAFKIPLARATLVEALHTAVSSR